MKICLISPYESVSSYGLRLLSSILKKNGHQVTSLFLGLNFVNESIPPESHAEIAKFACGSQLIGISLSSNYYRISIDLTRILKERCPQIPVLWGGIHPTIEPDECIKFCDMVCIGEAEEAIKELAQRMDAGQPCTDTRNFFFKQSDGSVIKNPLRPLVKDLDSLPLPDYSNQEQYILQDGKLIPSTHELLNENLSGQYLTLASRGCVNSCAYCCNSFLKELYKGDRWFRKRSIENVLEECFWVKDNLPWVTEILFDDDAFMARGLDELKTFVEAYKKRVGIPFFVTGVTPRMLSEEKLQTLIDGGMKRIRVGVQTASDRVNFDIYKRRISQKEALEAFKIVGRHIKDFRRTHYDFIVDNPWETEEEQLETLRFLLKIPRPWAINICSLTFYPGVELYERALKEGLIKDKFKTIYDKNFHLYRPSYVNKMFYFFCQTNLPVWALSLFVNKWVIALKLNWPLWWAYLAGRDAKHYFYVLKAKIRGK